jgi:hypothetical protein
MSGVDFKAIGSSVAQHFTEEEVAHLLAWVEATSGDDAERALGEAVFNAALVQASATDPSPDAGHYEMARRVRGA